MTDSLADSAEGRTNVKNILAPKVFQIFDETKTPDDELWQSCKTLFISGLG